jgi:hypothetical protein
MVEEHPIERDVVPARGIHIGFDLIASSQICVLQHEPATCAVDREDASLGAGLLYEEGYILYWQRQEFVQRDHIFSPLHISEPKVVFELISCNLLLL